MQPPSRWRDDRSWQQRVVRDRGRIAALSDEQRELARGVAAAADRDGSLDFAVIYGSVAQGRQRADSDIDVYFEASDLPVPFNCEDSDGRFHAFGMPRGDLLANMGAGDHVAVEIVRDAIVILDNGRLRELLIAVDEESLA
jgi:hypothetical protein